MAAFVLDKQGKPLMPCCEKRARLLLERGRATVHRVAPFVIRLKDRTAATCAFQPLALKFDPGSKTTGMAVVREANGGVYMLCLFELVHRGRQIVAALKLRKGYRQRRRSTLGYRKERRDYRARPEGWVPPSMQSRVNNIAHWVRRLRRWAPITRLVVEMVKFDTQRMQQPDIEGIEYQQGTLASYELWEYLLEKFQHTCAYCGVQDVPLEKDHIEPVSRGGSNRVSNFAVSCRPCNQKKDNQDVRDFLAHAPERLARILAQAKAPLRDAAAVNTLRRRTLAALQATGLPVETATGGRTKWNRVRFGLPKTHALDAVCAGEVEAVAAWKVPTLTIRAMGRGDYCRTRTDESGFPVSYLARVKQAHGFQTGDRVCADIQGGKHRGRHMGRVAIRQQGAFVIQTATGKVEANWRYCRIVQRGDGYGYTQMNTIH